MESESLELRKHISGLSDEELLEMLTKPGDYREEALKFAKAELARRGIDFEPPPPQQQIEPSAPIATFLETHGRVCPSCRGPLRYGTLVAEKELTVIFTDNREERFVRVSICRQCGQVLLTVDYETDVEE